MVNARKAPAKPVANLAQASKEQAAARKEQAQSRQRHPAGKAAPQKAAPAKAAPAAKSAPAKAAKKTAAKPAKPEAEKVTYSAVGRRGRTNTRQSTTPAATLDPAGYIGVTSFDESASSVVRGRSS